MLPFLVTPCLIVTVQPFIEWIPIKKKARPFWYSLHFGYLAVLNVLAYNTLWEASLWEANLAKS